MKKKRSPFLSLVLWYLLILSVQLLAGWASGGKIDPWYRNLTKAPWTPPSWIFGPVWTLLYFLMAVGVWLVARSPAPSGQRKLAFTLFFVQLFANGIWSFLFFGMHWIGAALIDLGVLFILVGATTWAFYRIRPLAGWCYVPYFLWTGYALSLNAALWWLNA